MGTWAGPVMADPDAEVSLLTSGQGLELVEVLGTRGSLDLPPPHPHLSPSLGSRPVSCPRFLPVSDLSQAP